MSGPIRLDSARPRSLGKAVADNGMSVALTVLFLACLAGQSLSGWLAYDQSLRDGRFPGIGYGAYLRTGSFLDGVFSNWQAAILQLAVLIAFGSVLRQKGAAHSRKPDDELKPGKLTALEWKIGPRPLDEWLYANSLSLAFLAMFALTFALHAAFGTMKHNEDQALRHLPPVSAGSYAASSDFWFSVLQAWEAEFGAIGVYVVLSIFLRQERSSESKPVGASDDHTGDANE